MDLTKIKKTYTNYYIVFQAEAPTTPYTPLVPRSFPYSSVGTNSLHGWDQDLSAILPALWYCLHLPRTGFDSMNLAPKLIVGSGFTMHQIFLIPSYMDRLPEDLAEACPPTLFIGEDACVDVAAQLAQTYSAPLGFQTISSLSSELLEKNWTEIGHYMKQLLPSYEILPMSHSLFQDEKRASLPVNFLAQQMSDVERIQSMLKRYKYAPEALLDQTYYFHSIIGSLAELEEQNILNPTKQQFIQALNRHKESASFPVVMSMPGRPARARPKVQDSSPEDEGITPIEQEVIQLLGIHDAAGKSGMWLDGGILPATFFSTLHQLEDHCRNPRINNSFVWRSMEKLGKLLNEHLGTIGPRVLHRASSFTALTDFPIGLAILPGLSDPLCCIKPISYRPLTPLTRAFQLGLQRTPEHYIGGGCKIVIAECVLPNDHIRPYSDAGWHQIRQMFADNERVEVVYEEIQSIQSMEELLRIQKDADILIISAHGQYDKEHNFAGLVIGEEIWMAAGDHILVPPVVILSACHVSPRGLGAVSVTDMLLRAGAKAILGTLIPVDVKRNALLTGRLFSYIAEALAGNRRFRSLDQAWHFVVQSNAVHEILSSSKWLFDWGYSHNSQYPASRCHEFQVNRSVGRLRTTHVYSDTLKILREMATEDGVRKQFDRTIDSQGYFPESCFYMFIGAPEKVIIHEPIQEQFRAKISKELS